MSSLKQWLEHQHQQLPLGLWLDLSIKTMRIDEAIKNEEYFTAQNLLPTLYATIESSRLPQWQVFAQSIEASLLLAATGDLNKVMSICMRALTTAEKLTGKHDQALRLSVHLLMIRCWMKIDEVGYAPAVLSVGEESLEKTSARDWRFWFLISNAWALWAMKRQEEANHALSEALSIQPDWITRADDLEGQAYISYRLRRQADAADIYKQAAKQFDEAGLIYGATRCRLNRALCLYEIGQHEPSLEIIDRVLPRAAQLINPHYKSLAYCIQGRNALATQDYQNAVDSLGKSLAVYEGRGWLRDEAQITIERLEAMHGLGTLEEWEETVDLARKRLSKLRSTDLQTRLNRLLADK